MVELTDSGPAPPDDIGRKRETPMNSISTPKAVEPNDVLIARADERLAHAYEQIARADEQLARLTEQLAKMERDASRPPSEPGLQPSPGKPAVRVSVGLLLAAFIIVAALVLQSSYGGRAKLIVTGWAAQFASTSSSPSENPPLPAQPDPSTVQVAAAETAPPQATPLVQTAPQGAAPIAIPALPDQTQLLQGMARALANVERDIEQLKANQQQMASDNSKAIERLKASQEEMTRLLARVSEQIPPKTFPPPTQPTPTTRKPERTLHSPQARARPRISRDWIYEDW
jgi:uncharacterized coiled-coil protein SlyX